MGTVCPLVGCALLCRTRELLSLKSKENDLKGYNIGYKISVGTVFYFEIISRKCSLIANFLKTKNT